MNKKLLSNAITAAKEGLVAFACVSIDIAENKPDELKQRILAQAQSLGPDDYAFTRTVKSDQTSNGKTEQHTQVDKFDPTKSGDARWTLVSVDGAPPSGDFLEKYKKETPKRTVPGYYRLAKYFGAA